MPWQLRSSPRLDSRGRRLPDRSLPSDEQSGKNIRKSRRSWPVPNSKSRQSGLKPYRTFRKPLFGVQPSSPVCWRCGKPVPRHRPAITLQKSGATIASVRLSATLSMVARLISGSAQRFSVAADNPCKPPSSLHQVTCGERSKDRLNVAMQIRRGNRLVNNKGVKKPCRGPTDPGTQEIRDRIADKYRSGHQSPEHDTERDAPLRCSGSKWPRIEPTVHLSIEQCVASRVDRPPGDPARSPPKSVKDQLAT